MTTKPSSAPESEHEPGQPTPSEAVTTEPAAPGSPAEPADTRARFRAALERKRSRQSGGAPGVSADPKIHGTHGAAGGKRVFRRKSG